MLKCFPNISNEKIVSLRAVRGSSWFEVYDPGADQWRLWKMLQSCLMDDGEFHSHCCASRLLLLLPPSPPCCSLTLLGLLSFFIESFNNLLCHPGLLLNSAALHSHSIHIIQRYIFYIIFKNGKTYGFPASVSLPKFPPPTADTHLNIKTAKNKERKNKAGQFNCPYLSARLCLLICSRDELYMELFDSPTMLTKYMCKYYLQSCSENHIL